MKKYVILGQLFGIGGWQMYINNKLIYCEQEGWDIYALSTGITSSKNFDYLPLLAKYRFNNFIEFAFTPSSLTSKQRLSVINRVKKMINFHCEDQIIFESTTEKLLLWTELLANTMNAKSICVNVKNRFHTYNSDFTNFFLFKKERGEFLMMINNGFHDLFSGFKDYPISENQVVSPLTYNVFYDDLKDYSEYLRVKKYDFIIGTIGWLDKPYYHELGHQIKIFANRYTDKKTLFIIIGSSMKGNIENEYRELFVNIENVDVEFMGSMHPIPSNLVRIFDVCIASYGCAVIADKLNVKTIMMHDDDDIPLGIMGYTLKKWPYVLNRTNTEKQIFEVLTDILIKKVCLNATHLSSNYGVDSINEAKKHFEFLDKSSQNKEYYNVLNIHEPSKRKRQIVFLSKIIGMKNITKIMRRKNK